jgi:hypothetical protein
MQFLNVLSIKKLAVAKGCTAVRTATISFKHYVALTGPDGATISGSKRGVGFSLAEAKRRLQAMPDLTPSVVDRKGRAGPARKAQGGAEVAAPRAPGQSAEKVTGRRRSA